MASRRPASSGLAVRIMRTTLIIGVVTVVAAGVVALVSTSRMSSRQLVGRDLMAAQLVDDRLSGRLQNARTELDKVRSVAESTESSAVLTPALESAVGTQQAIFRRILIVDGRGTVLGSSDGTATIGSLKDSPAFIAASDGARGFFTIRRPDGGWQLWAAAAEERRGPARMVLAQLDTEFVASSLLHASAENRSVLIVQDGDVLAGAGKDADARLQGARWLADSEHSGRVNLPPSDSGVLQGTYVDLTEIGPLQWRLVVLTPAGVPMLETWRAVLPSLAVLLIGGAVALVSAWSVSRRLVKPLRELERAARIAASGAYVRPIAVHGDDEVGRVAQAFNQMSVRLNSLHDLSQLLASASQVDQVLEGILRAMSHLVGPGLAGIYLYDEGQRVLMPAKISGLQSAAPTAVPTDGDGWLARALFSGEPQSLSDADAIRRELPGFIGEYDSALAVPLVAGFEPLGVVVALRGTQGTWTEAEQEMLKTFSAQAAVAVQTSRLFEFESRSRRVAEALRAVAEELVRPEGLDRALRKIEMVVTELFDASATAIVVVDRPSVALSGQASAQDAAVLAVALRALDRASSTARPTLIARGADQYADELLDTLGGEQLLVLPVALDTDHGAVMVIAGDRSLSMGESIQVAGAVADELALAFDNAYFYERAVSRAANLETIFRISQAVGSSLQVNVVLNRVLDVVQKILSADAVALLEYDGRKKSLTTAMARGDIPPSLLSVELVPGDDVPGYVFSSGQPATLRDMHPGMRGIAGDAAANDLRSLLAVPLLARGRPIGVLMVFSVDPSSFTDEDASMLQTFATQAALAIDTARLYSREHDVATVLQQSILPAELPEFDELEAGSVYAPAGMDAEIGGDYYDLFKDPVGDIWFSIADVCGKGVHAATRTSMIKYALRAFASAGMSPAQVLSGLNRMISEAGDPSDIVTVWVGRLDRNATRLTWANGGHPPGLLRHRDGTITPLEVTGPLLGAIPEVPFDEMCIGVTAGERILLYTDGVTEARSGNIFFGEQRVRDCFVGDGTSSDVAVDLLGAVRRFVRADLRDDVAVLVISLRQEDPECSDERDR